MLEITTFTGGIAATNGYVFRSKSGDSYVVDAPEGMADWLEAKGVAPRALLLTHAHFDHVLDAEKIRRRWQCPLYARTDPTPDLTLEAAWASLGTSLEVESYQVDHYLTDEGEVEIDGMNLAVRHVPGHSPDSLVFLLGEEGILFAGDVLMQGGIGRDDLPGGDGSLLRQGIKEKLYGLGDEVRVYPGHGGPTTIGEERRTNPFVR